MPAFLLSWFRLIYLFTRGHQALVLENLALRQQLGVYKRQSKRPRLNRSDRVFWIALASAWKGWRRVLLLVHPDTVVRWQRLRFRRYWAQLSCKPKGKVGRPPIGKSVGNLIQNMARANPLWRAPRIHGELLKLGIKVSERTVSRILRTVPRPPSQTWKTFLRNHIGEIVATDFFTVPTVGLRVLFVFLVLEHRRRKVLHFGVTERPTSEWVAQQMVEAFAERDAPRYLIRDRDASYGTELVSSDTVAKIPQLYAQQQTEGPTAVERIVPAALRSNYLLGMSLAQWIGWILSIPISWVLAWLLAFLSSVPRRVWRTLRKASSKTIWETDLGLPLRCIIAIVIYGFLVYVLNPPLLYREYYFRFLAALLVACLAWLVSRLADRGFDHAVNRRRTIVLLIIDFVASMAFLGV